LQSIAIKTAAGSPDLGVAIRGILTSFGVKKLADLNPAHYEAVESLIRALS
jgi:hypothetical protein